MDELKKKSQLLGEEREIEKERKERRGEGRVELDFSLPFLREKR